MAADRAGGAARRIQQHRIERHRRHPAVRIGLHHFRGEPPVAEVLAQAQHPGGIALQRGDDGAGGGKLRRLAARRGAEIGHALARPRRKQPRGQGGGGILHPEVARRRSPGFRSTRVPGGKPHRSGRQHLATFRRRRTWSERDIERRLVLMRQGDRPGLFAPGRPQPGRCIQARPVEFRQAAQRRLRPPAAARHSPARRTAISRRARASATAVATAAWLGVSSSSSPAAPMRRTWRTGSGGALRRNGSSTASSVPIRRSTAAASRCAAARSLGGNIGQCIQRFLERAALVEHRLSAGRTQPRVSGRTSPRVTAYCRGRSARVRAGGNAPAPRRSPNRPCRSTRRRCGAAGRSRNPRCRSRGAASPRR